MSQFTGPLRLEHLSADWRRWRLLEPLKWEVEVEGSGKFVEIPQGFVTDGATVPRLLWWLFPMTGSYLRAAALHDFLYVQIKGGSPHPLARSRKAADRQFRIAMKACGVSKAARWIMWAAVRIFGGR